MMGRPHALSGAAAWLIGAPLIATTANSISWLPDLTLTIPTYALGAVAATGAALAPDTDHPSAGLAKHSLGPVTKSLSAPLGFFGHRTLTHSFFGVGLAVGALVLLVLMGGVLGVAYAAVLTFFVSAFALAALYPKKSMSKTSRYLTRAVLAAAITAATVWVSDGDFGWLAVAYAMGLLVHVAGDAITVQGVPVFWPLKSWEYRLSPAIFLILFMAPVVFILYSMTPVAAVAVGALTLVLAGTMLRPFRAGDWQETKILAPIFVAVAAVAIVSAAVTYGLHGEARVAGYRVENSPSNSQNSLLPEVDMPSVALPNVLSNPLTKPSPSPSESKAAKKAKKDKKAKPDSTAAAQG